MNSHFLFNKIVKSLERVQKSCKMLILLDKLNNVDLFVLNVRYLNILVPKVFL